MGIRQGRMRGGRFGSAITTLRLGLGLGLGLRLGLGPGLGLGLGPGLGREAMGKRLGWQEYKHY